MTSLAFIILVVGISYLTMKPFMMVFGDLTQYNHKQLKKFQSTLEEMEKSKKKIDEVLTNSPGAICQFILDANGNISCKYFSNQAFIIFEISLQDFNKDHSLLINMVHDQDKSSLVSAILNSSKTLTNFMWEGRIVTRSEKIKYLKLESAPRKDTDGHIVWNGVMIDITKEKILEQDLVNQNKLVEHSSRLTAIGEISAGITHEINNPLAIVTLKLDDLREKIERKDYNESDVNQCFEYIDDAVDRISKITNSLRYFSNPNSREEISNIGKEISLSLTLIKELYRNNGIKLEYSEPADDLYIISPPTYVHQVIMNLVSNAKDALEGSENPTISINIQKQGDFACINVKDNGPGIPDDIQNMILQPFFTTKNASKGTGIGLSMCKSLVSLVGGDISFESSGKGTQFNCKFKLQKDSKMADASTLQVNPDKRHEDRYSQVSLKILIVDDEAYFADILERQMEQKSFNVVFKNDANSALEILKNRDFDVIISDQNMPSMNGVEFFNEIKRTGVSQGSLKILMSGDTNTEGLKGDYNLFIPKPFKVSYLIDLINQSDLKAS